MQTQRECTQFTHLCIYEYQVVRPWLSGDGWALIGNYMQTQRECTQFTHLCIYEYQVVRPWLSGDGWALIGTICPQLSSIIIHVNYNKVHMQTADPYPCSLVSWQ